jgi:tyrosinase
MQIIVSIVGLWVHILAKAAFATCTEPRVRYSWDSLSDAKRHLFKSALRLSMQRGHYQKFVEMHGNEGSNQEAHGQELEGGWRGSCVFMFWHRYFLIGFENMLRSLGAPYECLTLPYFDYVSDYNKQLTGSSCLNNEQNFFACSSVAQDLGGVTGKTRSMNDFYGSTYEELTCVNESPADAFCPQSNDFSDPNKCDRCIPRSNWREKSFAYEQSYHFIRAEMFSNDTTSYTNWSSTVEYTTHNVLHAMLGGPLGTFSAPVDPIFYLHHATLDLLQTIYLHCHRNEKGPRNVAAHFDETCTSGIGRPLLAQTTVAMIYQNENSDKHADTAAFFKNVPNTYQSLIDPTQLGVDSSYSYQIHGGLGLIYQECSASADDDDEFEENASKTPSHEVILPFHTEDLQMQALESVIAEQAKSQGLTVAQGHNELLKIIAVAHEACVPGGHYTSEGYKTSGGVPDQQPIDMDNSDSHSLRNIFLTTSSKSHELWKSIQSNKNPIHIREWEKIVLKYLQCNVSHIFDVDRRIFLHGNVTDTSS